MTFFNKDNFKYLFIFFVFCAALEFACQAGAVKKFTYVSRTHARPNSKQKRLSGLFFLNAVQIIVLAVLGFGYVTCEQDLVEDKYKMSYYVLSKGSEPGTNNGVWPAYHPATKDGDNPSNPQGWNGTQPTGDDTDPVNENEGKKRAPLELILSGGIFNESKKFTTAFTALKTIMTEARDDAIAAAGGAGPVPGNVPLTKENFEWALQHLQDMSYIPHALVTSLCRAGVFVFLLIYIGCSITINNLCRRVQLGQSEDAFYNFVRIVALLIAIVLFFLSAHTIRQQFALKGTHMALFAFVVILATGAGLTNSKKKSIKIWGNVILVLSIVALLAVGLVLMYKSEDS